MFLMLEGGSLSKKQRFDRAFIKDYNATEEGYLTVRDVVTKPGVYPYGREDGSIQNELKHPGDIYSDRTVQSCNAKPVTDDHPNEPVNMKNIKAYGKGMSHTDAKVQSGDIMVGFTITDEALIEKIYDGKREISLGFMTDLVAEDGTYNNKNYQFRQTNVEVNHIATVDQGRVGPEAAIKGDACRTSMKVKSPESILGRIQKVQSQSLRQVSSGRYENQQQTITEPIF
ncbi:hypothetical protein SAMN05421687_11066 [Salimicrobium flavidum]|uniref:Uncharacterized protein n=1 Tax=Salimicrobium flavidum TaxID=570947 RepID=A0A1N7KDL3_9BACI|nr:hypothetical protein SAMN05421687_11066 [Salimicrobium flavidum]